MKSSGPRETHRAGEQGPAGCNLRATRLLLGQAAGGRCGSSGGSASPASPDGTGRGAPHSGGLPGTLQATAETEEKGGASGAQERRGGPPGSASPSPSWPRPPRLGRLYPGTQHHSSLLTQRTSFLVRRRMLRLPRPTERPDVRGVATFGSRPGKTPSGGRSSPIRNSFSGGRSPEPMKWQERGGASDAASRAKGARRGWAGSDAATLLGEAAETELASYFGWLGFPARGLDDYGEVGKAVGLEAFVLICEAVPQGLPYSPNILDSHIPTL